MKTPKHSLRKIVSFLNNPDGDGGMAMDACHLMCAEKDQAKLEALRAYLLKYCERDTEAMVKLHQLLVAMIFGWKLSTGGGH